MRRSKHRISAFSLSFLDIMACGFGAVTLLFLILKHDAISLESADPLLNAEVNLLQEDLRVGEEALHTGGNVVQVFAIGHAVENLVSGKTPIVPSQFGSGLPACKLTLENAQRGLLQ